MVALIPQPQRVDYGAGHFTLTGSTKIITSPACLDQATHLANLLSPATGFALEIETADKAAADNAINLILAAESVSYDEGYALQITPRSVTIEACTCQGIFYGIQTLRQLLPAAIERATVQQEAWTLPALTITDQPRFAWRGLMLDVGRYMYPVEFLKKFIDLMALYKYNTFHWHLTEDQGWRIEIKRYPRLTEIGAYRTSSPPPEDRLGNDHTPYGGYYTQDEIREIVAYAADRFITVVPEIEMPGHAQAALAAHPHLGCVGEGYVVSPKWNIHKEVYCAGNPDVYAFLENVLAEVFDLFPGEFVHIGGDECLKDRWRECPKCQALLQREGLRDEDELQSYFIHRMEGFLNEHGRRLIGWDEILEGGLAPNATVMSWRGSQGGIDAASAGHDVVMTPNTHCYFDYYQSEDRENEPPTIGGHLPLRQVHTFDPTMGIPADKTGHVLGGQGNIWTEHMPTSALVEYMTYPRACALAEALWTSDLGRDFDDFKERLDAHLPRLDALAVGYRKPRVEQG